MAETTLLEFIVMTLMITLGSLGIAWILFGMSVGVAWIIDTITERIIILR